MGNVIRDLKVGDVVVVVPYTNTSDWGQIKKAFKPLSINLKVGDEIEVVNIEYGGSILLNGATAVRINGGDVVEIGKNHLNCWAFFTSGMIDLCYGLAFRENLLPHQLPVHKDYIETKPLQERYDEWVVNNMGFYELFCKFAFEAINSGKTRISHWLIINRIRWECNVVGTPTCTEDRDFKISNDYIAFMARDFIKDHPEHDGLFNFKQMKRVP